MSCESDQQPNDVKTVTEAFLSGDNSGWMTSPLSEEKQQSILERLRTRETPLLATPKAHGD